MRHLLIIAVIVLCACNAFQKQTIDRAILIDKTDTSTVLPSPRDMFSSLAPDKHKWDEINFRVQIISNLDYNPVFHIKLNGKQALLSNPYDRDEELHLFEQKFVRAIDSVNRMAAGLPRSSIYRSVIREANRMAVSKATVKQLLVYSNLGQNTKEFSVYNDSYIKLLKENPDTIVKMLIKTTQPENLSGITIYLMHTPRDEADNEVYSLMAAVFKQILEDAGADVHVGANEADVMY